MQMGAGTIADWGKIKHKQGCGANADLQRVSYSYYDALAKRTV